MALSGRPASGGIVDEVRGSRYGLPLSFTSSARQQVESGVEGLPDNGFGWLGFLYRL